MRLRKKILLTMIILSFILVSIFYSILTTRLNNDYTMLERERLIEKINIVEKEIKSELSEINIYTRTLSYSNETYQFVQKINPTYIELVLCSQTFINGNINVIEIINDKGVAVEKYAFDLKTRYYTAFPSGLDNYTKTDSQLFTLPNYDSSVEGIVNVSGKTLLLVSQPITTYNRRDIKGTIILGRFLTENTIKPEIGSDANVTFGYNGRADLTSDFKNYLHELVNSTTIITEVRSPHIISGYSYIADIYNKPALLFRVDIYRSAQEIADKSYTFFLLSSIALGVALCAASFLFLDSLVVSRITKLSRNVRAIRTGKEKTTEIAEEGDDELGYLASDINGMLESIQNSNTQLMESEKMATLGKTTLMVGHDLRNPLQAVTDACELTIRRLQKMNGKEKKDLDELITFQKIIKDQIVYMDKIVSDLQDYSRKITPILTEVNISNLIDEVIKHIKIPQNIDVKISNNSEYEIVKTDPSLLRRVITNLVNNAIQAMPSGGTVTLRLLKKGDLWGLDVEDTGVGISEVNMHSIFTPLYTTKPKGVGLGLTVVKRIVEALDGTVEFKSEIAKGSTFTIWLPNNSQ